MGLLKLCLHGLSHLHAHADEPGGQLEYEGQSGRANGGFCDSEPRGHSLWLTGVLGQHGGGAHFSSPLLQLALASFGPKGI